MMYWCGLPRAGGKTTEMINEAAAHPGTYIVTCNRDEVSRVFEEARKMGKSIAFPLTYDEFLGRRFHGPGIGGFVIDNVDQLLRHMCCGIPLLAASFDTSACRLNIKGSIEAKYDVEVPKEIKGSGRVSED